MAMASISWDISTALEHCLHFELTPYYGIRLRICITLSSVNRIQRIRHIPSAITIFAIIKQHNSHYILNAISNTTNSSERQSVLVWLLESQVICKVSGLINTITRFHIMFTQRIRWSAYHTPLMKHNFQNYLRNVSLFSRYNPKIYATYKPITPLFKMELRMTYIVTSLPGNHAGNYCAPLPALNLSLRWSCVPRMWCAKLRICAPGNFDKMRCRSSWPFESHTITK